MPQQNKQQHTFKMTLGGADNDDDDDGQGGFGKPPPSQSGRQPSKLKVTGNNYLSSGLPQTIQPSTSAHTNRQTIQIGNKDLIIRMLAEIFQVKQDENGLVRWQQISTSLVPISLYSRTTSKWLDYLLAASASIHTHEPANAMSPDSRDFLLLLQQFHQQTRPTIRLNQFDTMNNNEHQQYNESIVFQVIGHDVINGHCKKILNVKIKQPGTRLGQASDYFVYWREQASATNQKFHNLHHQQFSASSYASNNSFTPQTPKASAQMLNYPATNLSGRNNRLIAPGAQQTWGLNFASLNDAKLFYDICSLNLVDLDFNSEYLKQLAVSDTLQYRQQDVTSCKIPMATNPPYPLIANSARLKQQNSQSQLSQLQQQQRLLRNKYQKMKENSTKLEQTQHKALARGQSSMSRCPSCKQAVDPGQKRSTASAAQTGLRISGGFCPVHGNDLKETIRMRSRSTTRQLSTAAKENENFKRARSFSTPASPEPDHCPVHRRRHRANTDCEQQQVCAQRRREQQLEQIKYNILAQDSGPQKPARGQLRLAQTVNSQESSSNLYNLQQQKCLPQAPLINQSCFADCNQTVLHLKRNQKSRYMALQNLTQQQQPDQWRKYKQQIPTGTRYVNERGHQVIAVDYPAAAEGNLKKNRRPMQQSVSSNLSSFQTRAQMGADTFDTIARRDARLARARYANSKNMKEFLSLDAGGLQSTPTQQIFHRQQQQTRQQQQLPQPKLTDSNTKSAKDATKISGLVSVKQESVEQYHQKKQILNDKKSQQATKQSMQSDDKELLSAGGVDQCQINPNACLGSVQSMATQETGDTTQCNASTTTDDLPMDISTRRRMMKLTSEEVISERTEPKSISTSTAIEQKQEQQSKLVMNAAPTGREEKIDRQVRAVSLGPEFSGDTKIRGRVARSDASRRRSLERSTCVDLDAFLPASSFMKCSRLSPLPQSSTSPQGLAASCGSSKSSPSCPNPERGAPPAGIVGSSNIASMMNEHHNRLNDVQLDSMRHEAQSYGLDGRHNRYQMTDLVDGQSNSQCAFDDRQFATCHERQMFLERQLASFKSAPDIRLPELEQVNDMASLVNSCDPYQPAEDIYINAAHHKDARADLSNNILKDERQDFNDTRIVTGLPRGRSNLSSYAVPLCSTVKRPPQQTSAISRQCQSCPSSLRRKRTLSNRSDMAEVELLHDCVTSPMYSHRYPHICSCMQISCPMNRGQNASLMHQYCDCYVDQADNIIPHPNGGCPNCESMYSNLPPNHAQHCFSQQRSYCNHNRTYHHHHCNQPTKDALSYVKRVALNSDQSQPMQSFRSHSSQSNRSPMQYGLYESDLEDELVRIEQEFVEPSRGYHDSFSLSQSAYFQPAIIKPVQGYDQTMARVALKSRQRSRSQPPSCSTDARSSFHLTKSMENVEKLIKEVQNELRALKRQPLGTAHIDMTTSGTTHHIGSESVPKTTVTIAPKAQENLPTNMSLDDNEKNPREQSNSKFSYTSATRRAGQFKCVGAIRKAGFLSVKKWILKRRQSIELARKQGWKRYWVCLRGTALLFHSVIENRVEPSPTNENSDNQTDLLSWIQMNCSSQMNFITNLLQTENDQKGLSRDAFFKNLSQVYIEKEPRHLIIIDGSIAQPIPEHPRRDFVFCLSTTFGDAYLFQASCQLESDNWISAIHNACAASIARDLTREEAIKLFETKIRHFELEAEKKIFLRQRLESRLTSMSSICNVNRLNINNTDSDRYAKCDDLITDKNKLTMRSLLYQLNQQLLALDTYIEQLRCEVYQLRCYLSSCGAQNVFYQNIQNQLLQQQEAAINQSNIPCDLPHPKSLLMHVSKPTKLLLIKLGIFTVSSFHAYIHARQDSAKTILQQIQQTTTSGNPKASCSASSLELRIRSHSISESLLSKTENVKLEDETENLLEMANLKTVSIQLNKSLICRIKRQEENELASSLVDIGADTSDDRYSIQDLGENINMNIRLNPSSNSSSIIKQVLKIIEPDLPELEFLNYYLRLVVGETNNGKEFLNKRQITNFYIVKRKETLSDWSNCIYIELLEKIIFRVELNRSRMEEEAATPFGISVDGQLFSSKYESVLNVYCNYIEWGSVADKAGLQDEDEFLLINGIPVGDLDLMFVECIIQDACKLKAVVRSAATECPPNAIQLDKTTWRPLDDDGDNNQGGRCADRHQDRTLNTTLEPERDSTAACSQVISDAYLTSLVCPPPPAKSSAFLRTDLNMLRQKSDLGMERQDKPDVIGNNRERKEVPNSNNIPLPKSKSQHKIDASKNIDDDSALIGDKYDKKNADGDSATIVTSSVDLAAQLLKRTERLTKLLGKDPINDADKLLLNVHLSTSSCGSKAEHNHLERLQKSILELIETEYAYIRHLETISEHYMSPLEETGFLNIGDLRSFNRIVLAILRLQREFFDLLTTDIAKECQLNINESDEEFERFNGIIQQTDSFRTVENLKPIVTSIAKLFLSEADKFKIYTSYCAAYSKLQKILHPKNSNGSSNLPGVSITSIPNALNTFSNSLTTNSIGGLGHFTAQQRESRLVNLTMTNGNCDQDAQLKQLTEFLGNLDSSSSSASLSLAKSSESEYMANKNQKSKRGTFTSNSIASAQISANSTYQKSVHQQNFESYLIKPIQRIVKYPMLLNSIGLAAQAYYSNEPVNNDLKCAIKHMEVIVNHVNDMQRVHDEYGLTFDHIERQYFEQQALDSSKTTVATLFGPHQPAISLDVAQLLYFGPVEWLNMNEFSSKAKRILNLNSMLFVFDSCVVFTCKERVRSTKRRLPLKNNDVPIPQQITSSGLTSKVFPWSTSNGGEQFTEIVRYQTLIPVSEVQVRSVPIDQQASLAGSRDNNNNNVAKSQVAKYQWELFQCSSSNSNSSLLTKATSAKRTNTKNDTGKVYLLSSPSNEERSTFLRKIRFIIRESVRNMSLPAPRSPSSKSLTSKKLSTSSASSATSATSNANINSSCSPAASVTVR